MWLLTADSLCSGVGQDWRHFQADS